MGGYWMGGGQQGNVMGVASSSGLRGDNSGWRRVVNTLKFPAGGSVETRNGKDRRGTQKDWWRRFRRVRERENKKARKQAVQMMQPIHRSVPPFFFSSSALPCGFYGLMKPGDPRGNPEAIRPRLMLHVDHQISH